MEKLNSFLERYSQFHFFYNGPFSQWAKCTMVIDGITYNCAEQYMMAMKAKHFNDERVRLAIMNTDLPFIHKALGRKVANFDVESWNKVCRGVVYKVNYEKFTQNEFLMSELKQTTGKLIVEASPTDRIWGIGLWENDKRIHDPKQWRGTNWLGEAITQVREDLGIDKIT